MGSDLPALSMFASFGDRPAHLELTADRLLLLLEGDMVPYRDIALGRVVAVREQSGVLTGYLTVTVPDEDLAFSRISKKQLVPFVEALRARVAAAPPEEDLPTPAMTTSLETLEDLERLGRLRSTGVITDEEFEAAKAKMLGRL